MDLLSKIGITCFFLFYVVPLFLIILDKKYFLIYNFVMYFSIAAFWFIHLSTTSKVGYDAGPGGALGEAAVIYITLSFPIGITFSYFSRVIYLKLKQAK